MTLYEEETRKKDEKGFFMTPLIQNTARVKQCKHKSLRSICEEKHFVTNQWKLSYEQHEVSFPAWYVAEATVTKPGNNFFFPLASSL